MEVINTKDIKNLFDAHNDLYQKINNSIEINQLQYTYLKLQNDDDKHVYFLIFEEHYNTIKKFKNSLIDLNYTIYMIDFFYKKNNLKYIVLYKNSNDIIKELNTLYDSILNQTKKINCML